MKYGYFDNKKVTNRKKLFWKNLFNFKFFTKPKMFWPGTFSRILLDSLKMNGSKNVKVSGLECGRSGKNARSIHILKSRWFLGAREDRVKVDPHEQSENERSSSLCRLVSGSTKMNGLGKIGQPLKNLKPFLPFSNGFFLKFSECWFQILISEQSIDENVDDSNDDANASICVFDC